MFLQVLLKLGRRFGWERQLSPRACTIIGRARSSIRGVRYPETPKLVRCDSDKVSSGNKNP